MSETELAGRRGAGRPGVVVGIAALVVAVLLVVFAVELAHTQTTTREAVETRFRDRARVTSALTEALFGSLGSSTENARLYGGADVDDARHGPRRSAPAGSRTPR